MLAGVWPQVPPEAKFLVIEKPIVAPWRQMIYMRQLLRLIIKRSQLKQQNKTDSWFGELKMNSLQKTALLPLFCCYYAPEAY